MERFKIATMENEKVIIEHVNGYAIVVDGIPFFVFEQDISDKWGTITEINISHMETGHAGAIAFDKDSALKRLKENIKKYPKAFENARDTNRSLGIDLPLNKQYYDYIN